MFDNANGTGESRRREGFGGVQPFKGREGMSHLLCVTIFLRFCGVLPHGRNLGREMPKPGLLPGKLDGRREVSEVWFFVRNAQKRANKNGLFPFLYE
jgi:hypothetical protein